VSEGENTIDGYELTNCVASGNASEIWEVSSQSGGSQPLCMKLLLPHALEDANAKQVLKHEAKVGKSLDHPSIVKIHKVAVTKQHGYILMDYFRAPNIKQQISGDHAGLQARFRKVFESLCLALGYMHEKGWVHKDIKPENILSNKVGELRLIDFSLAVRASGGLAKLLGGSKSVQGTRTYIAPETLLKKAPTIQTDMYSLGVTVFEMLTGNPPFRGMSPNELLRMHVQEPAPPVSASNPNVTQEMDRLVARLLEKKPAKRHKNMEEVYAEFRGLKVFKEDPMALESQRKQKRKHEEMDALGASDRINSRRDHQRSEAGLNEPNKPIQPKPAPKPQQAPAQPQPQQPAQQPAAGQGYPPVGNPYPNYAPPPGYAFPPGAQPPPGYPPPQPPYGYPPGQFPQQQPGQQPPQQQPGQQPPQQQPGQQPPQQQPGQQPPQQQPGQQPPQQQPVPAAQQPPAQPQPASGPPQAGQSPPQPKPAQESPQPPQTKREHPETNPRKEDEDLELMDELPDVI